MAKIPAVGAGITTQTVLQACKPRWEEPKLPIPAPPCAMLNYGTGGTETVPLVVRHITGPGHTTLYNQCNYVGQDVDGKLKSNLYWTSHLGFTHFARQELDKFPVHAGPRGASKLSGYAWYDGHPSGMWIGIDLRGSVICLERDGHSEVLMGPDYAPAEHPLVKFPKIGKQNYVLTGEWEIAPRNTPGFCLDVANPNIGYATDYELGVVFKLDLAAKKATVIASGMLHPMGICMTTTGYLVVACIGDIANDQSTILGTGAKLWRIDPDGTKHEIIAYENGVEEYMPWMWVSAFSDGRVAAACWWGHIMDLDPITGDFHHITFDPAASGIKGGFAWITVSVDRNGLLFPKDTVVWEGFQGMGKPVAVRRSNGHFRILATGRSQGIPCGPEDRVCEAIHYPWLSCIHPHIPAILFGGSGGIGITEAVAKPATFPTSTFNSGVYNWAMAMWRKGGPSSADPKDCSSFISLWGMNGGSWMGRESFDEMAYWTDADLNTLFRNWHSGFSDAECEALRYMVRISSNRALVESIPAPKVVPQPVLEWGNGTEYWVLIPTGPSTVKAQDKYGNAKAVPTTCTWHITSETVDGITVYRVVVDSNTGPLQLYGLSWADYSGALPPAPVDPYPAAQAQVLASLSAAASKVAQAQAIAANLSAANKAGVVAQADGAIADLNAVKATIATLP